MRSIWIVPARSCLASLLAAGALSGCAAPPPPARETAAPAPLAWEVPADALAVTLSTGDPDSAYVAAGGAEGALYLAPRAGSWQWLLEARGLSPRRAYRLELKVDGNSYGIASLVAGDGGAVRAAGELEMLAEQLCVDDPQPPRRLASAREVRVRLRDDGSDPAASRASADPMSSGGAVPCRGNADGRWDYRLFETAPLRLPVAG